MLSGQGDWRVREADGNVSLDIDSHEDLVCWWFALTDHCACTCVKIFLWLVPDAESIFCRLFAEKLTNSVHRIRRR